MSLGDIRFYLEQARHTGTINSIYFEGGEPFLYYATLLQGVRMAAEMDFQVGIVSNAYWATSQEDALETLKPFAGLLSDLTVSSDLFHYDEKLSQQAQNATHAAQVLGIPLGVICIERPEVEASASSGQIPLGDSGVMYRGRAAEKLVQFALPQPWETFTRCPHEDLRDPGRVHLDPLGNLHICHGISLGNLHEHSLSEICTQYDPDSHAICGALLSGGPVALVNEFDLPHQERYADACHLCFTARQDLRSRFPHLLTPDQMYSVSNA